MSHDLNHDQSLLERSWELDLETPASSTSANSAVNESRQVSSTAYANSLMDELFGDVDRILDGSLIPPSETVKLAEPPKVAPFKADFMNFVGTLQSGSVANPPVPLPLNLPTTVPTDDELELPAPATELTRHEKRKESYGLFEKLLIFVGTSSAMAALFIWLASHGILSRMLQALDQSSQPVATVPAAPTVSPADQKFSDYMGRALTAIDQKVAGASSAAPNALLPTQTGVTSAAIPKVLVPGTPGTRVASGVILPNPPAPNATKGLPSAPVATNLTGLEATRNELNQIVLRLSALLDRIAPGTSAKLPQLAMAQKPGQAAAISANSPVTPAAPAPQRTLTALLEMGDRSAALFELNGVTQRVYLGESIGSSGWTLVEVSQDRAVIRKNGEVRTISVGQKI